MYLDPKVTNKKQLAQYGKFKKSTSLGKNSYVYQYIKQTHSVIEKIVKHNHANF